MTSKRPIDSGDHPGDDTGVPERKRARSGFNVGPDNLPDGTWKRKVLKTKKNLIQKAKIKKSYAKVKAQVPHVDTQFGTEEAAPTDSNQEIHPERQAMLHSPDDTPRTDKQSDSAQTRRRPRKPAYFEKELSFAEQKMAEAEARRLEFDRREKERRQRMEERERARKSMAKARSGGRNGQRKLGRESTVLLDRVRRLVGET